MAVAEVFELDAGPAEIRGRFAGVIAALGTVRSDADALALSNELQNQLVAFDSQLIARSIAAGAGDRETEDLAGRGRLRTKREARKGVHRARAVNANPDLGADLAAGALTLGGLDAIASAAEQSDGAAAIDVDLVERIKASPPDRAAGIARDWLDDHTSPDAHESRYQQQRRLRKVSKYPTTRGLMAICAEGDREHIDEIWGVLTAESKRLYRLDGGRDVASHKHPRTRHQRLFDALHTLTTTGNTRTDNAGTGAVGDTSHSDGEDSGTGGPAPVDRRVQVYVTLTLDELLDGATKARLVGGGTIPTTLLQDYLAGDANVAAMLFDGDGHVLWHGRNKRWATQPQLQALIARDEGCTICHAHPSACEGHHLIPYNSPAQGKTNTDELALVCTDCHHHIHTNRLTLYCEPDPHAPRKLVWKLRPATPEEIPP